MPGCRRINRIFFLISPPKVSHFYWTKRFGNDDSKSCPNNASYLLDQHWHNHWFLANRRISIRLLSTASSLIVWFAVKTRKNRKIWLWILPMHWMAISTQKYACWSIAITTIDSPIKVTFTSWHIDLSMR